MAVGSGEWVYLVGSFVEKPKLTMGRDAESTTRESDCGGGVERGERVLV